MQILDEMIFLWPRNWSIKMYLTRRNNWLI